MPLILRQSDAYIPDEDIQYILQEYAYYTETASSSDWSAVEQQMIVNNRLLGIIVALLVVFAIAGLAKFFYSLVTNNITNYF